MSYLHGKDGYHCDLKADNVFVRENDSGQLHAAIGEPSIMMVRLISRSPNNMLLDRAVGVGC
jgi:serine/threonine protein kinase